MIYSRRLLNKAKVKVSLYITEHNTVRTHEELEEQHFATKRRFALPPLCLKEVPMATHGLGSWMAPRGCSDFWWRGKYFAPAGNLDSFLGRLARSVRQVGSFKTEVNKYINSFICLQNTALVYCINFAETYGTITNAGSVNEQQ